MTVCRDSSSMSLKSEIRKGLSPDIHEIVRRRTLTGPPNRFVAICKVQEDRFFDVVHVDDQVLTSSTHALVYELHRGCVEQRIFADQETLF